MTIANDLIKLALRSSGVNGVGQTPLAEDVNDGLTLLNDMIGQWQLQRTVQVIPGTLDLFPDLTTDVASWTGHENVLLTTLMVRLRAAYFLPPDEILVQVATAALQTFQSNAKQFQPAPAIALVDTTAQGVIFLALRAAGRITDAQGAIVASQDATDAFLLLNEMIGEWNLDRTVTVTPGTIPSYPDLTTTVAQTTGANSAIMWNLAVRIRSAFGLDDSKVQIEAAARSLALIQANNRQQQPAIALAANDGTGFGLVLLALRACGRVTDDQNVTQTSQDTTDGVSMLQEMLDEWRLERTVRVIPGTLPVITDFTAALSLAPGYANAIMLNLAVRMRDAFGLPDNKPQAQRAADALALIQANNRQQQSAPTIAADDGSGYGLVFLALRAAGRVNDDQGVSLTSQDVTDTQSMLTEMLDEWRLERTVRVIPGTLPTITNFTATLDLTPGVANAIVLNLAIRTRDAFGLPENKSQAERAANALALLQANNQQRQPSKHAWPPSTCMDVIYLALRAAGRIDDNQNVDEGSADVDSAFSMLSGMMAQWQRRRWLNPGLVDLPIRSTGAKSYSLGQTRPAKLESAYFLLNPDSDNPVSVPLKVIQSHEDYAELVGLKDLSTIPSAVFYDTAWATEIPGGQPNAGQYVDFGVLYFTPIPPADIYEMHVLFVSPQPIYANVNSLLAVPPEYIEAMITNLPLRIMALNPKGPQPTPNQIGLARAAMATVRNANLQVSELRMPAGFSPGRRGSGVAAMSSPSFLTGMW